MVLQDTALSLTSSMFEPLMNTVTGTIETMLPFGLAIMGVMIGVRLIPRLIHMFM